MQKILCVEGSPRKGGNSDILMRHMVKGSRDNNVPVEEILLRNYRFQSCSGCERCRQDRRCTGFEDDMQLIYPGIVESRGLILISPVHNYNITAMMKSFIDRLYPFYNFDVKRPGRWSSRLEHQNRKAIVAAIAEQSSPQDSGINLALQALRLPVEALGYEVIAEMPVTGIFEKGKIAQYPDVLAEAEALGKRLAVLINT